MNTIINLFESQNKKVIDLTNKINYSYQIEKKIIKNVQDEKYNNTCFILDINKLDDSVKKYVHNKYNQYNIKDKEEDNNNKDFFILFYKHKFLHSYLNNNDITELLIKKFIYLTDEEAKINNAKLIITYDE